MVCEGKGNVLCPQCDTMKKRELRFLLEKKSNIILYYKTFLYECYVVMASPHGQGGGGGWKMITFILLHIMTSP